MMEEFEDGGATDGLVQCKSCQRCFLPKVLDKHVKICQKMTKKRKVFDSSRQRAEGTDISTLKPIKAKLHCSSSTNKSCQPEPPKKQSNWRKKHQDFIATIRAAKAVTQVMKDGGPLPPPPPPTYDPDYIQCPYCQRRFNENAADRHIKFCGEQAARMPNKSKPVETKKTPIRTQLKPSAPVKKISSPVVSTSPTSSRLPQRSGLGQPSGAAFGKVPSAGPVKTSPSGIISPPSGVGLKNRAVGSYGSAKSAGGSNKKKADVWVSQTDSNRGEEVGNGGLKSRFCHSCGSKYPVESAKFCCECGIKRIHL